MLQSHYLKNFLKFFLAVHQVYMHAIIMEIEMIQTAVTLFQLVCGISSIIIPSIIGRIIDLFGSHVPGYTLAGIIIHLCGLIWLIIIILRQRKLMSRQQWNQRSVMMMNDQQNYLDFDFPAYFIQFFKDIK